MKRRPSVALLIESSNAYARGLLTGIAEFQKREDAWSITLPEQERGAVPPRWIQAWRGDGIIARIENAAIAEALEGLPVPIVDVSAARRLTAAPWVETDDAAIARLAFDHLRERGFERLAFCGLEGFNWSLWREQHFIACCEADDIEVDVFRSRAAGALGAVSPAKERVRLSRWLRGLAKPVGLLAAFDILAQMVLDQCRSDGIVVPDQVGVMGVDNDPLLCDLSSPSLTSIQPDAIGAGRLAAQLLDRLMHAQPVKLEGHLLSPLGVASRRSTDVFAVEDPMMRQAMEYIRDHACDGINVEDLLRVIPLSRRLLEYRFRKATGRTPHEMIVRRRLDRVAWLLRETDLSLEAIAQQCGFEYPEYMNTLFKRTYGIPPGQFRRQTHPSQPTP